ncbi:MAG: FHA domain-containing protein [Chloroflexi bacterium]|nr:FHA domain-containing protein [Chloroflexota bacterium]
MTHDIPPGELTLSGNLGGGPQHTPAAAPEEGHLEVYLDGSLVRTFALNVPLVTMGRTPANLLPLPDPLVSRAHADLRVSPQAVILTDRNSANGTFVNDVRLAPEQPVQLEHGSVIRIGPFVIRYVATAPTPVDTGTSEPELAEERPAPPEPTPDLVTVPPAVFEPAPAPRPVYAMPLPREAVSSYLDFLPVIFHDGDFLGRFLMIFQSIWEPLEYRQDHMDMYFDARTSPPSFLTWLADWLGVSVGPVMEEGRLRNLLGEAVELYRWRGTRYGLTRLIEVCTGLRPVIAEAPSNPAVLHIRVTIPSDSTMERDMIERLIREHKPAHTAYRLEVFSESDAHAHA